MVVLAIFLDLYWWQALFYGTPGSLLDRLRDVLEVFMISMRRHWAVGAVRDGRKGRQASDGDLETISPVVRSYFGLRVD